MAEFYVYTLSDESRLDRHGQPTVFHVGKGTGDRADETVHGRNEFFKRYVAKMTTEPLQRRFPVGSEAEAFELERFLIAEIGRRNINRGPLTNLTDGGEGFSGLVHTEQHRAKIAEAQKGRVFSAEHRSKLSAAKKGKPGNPVALAAMRAAHIGKKHPPEFGAAISKRKKGQVGTMKGRKFTDEHRANMSAAQKAVQAAKRAA